MVNWEEGGGLTRSAGEDEGEEDVEVKLRGRREQNKRWMQVLEIYLCCM